MRLCATVFGAAAVVMSGAAPQEQLTIRVVDYVPVPGATPSEALLVSHAILRQAGMETTWLRSRIFEEKPCNSLVQPAEVRLNMLDRPHARQMAVSGALGYVRRNKQTAFALYVFYGRVEDVAQSVAFGPSLLLGTVVTHELGHYFGLDRSASLRSRNCENKSDCASMRAGINRIARCATRIRNACSFS
jgi:hypothetical protein